MYLQGRALRNRDSPQGLAILLACGSVIFPACERRQSKSAPRGRGGNNATNVHTCMHVYIYIHIAYKYIYICIYIYIYIITPI